MKSRSIFANSTGSILPWTRKSTKRDGNRLKSTYDISLLFISWSTIYVLSLTIPDLKLVCGIIGLEKAGKKDELLNTVLNFCVNPTNSGKAPPAVKRECTFLIILTSRLYMMFQVPLPKGARERPDRVARKNRQQPKVQRRRTRRPPSPMMKRRSLMKKRKRRSPLRLLISYTIIMQYFSMHFIM